MRARRWWAWPLVPVYWAGLRVKDGLRAVGVLRVRRLGWPVVSVGSLSAGGAGKTPVVIALAEMLKQRGWYVDVLSRGYGRVGSEVERVDEAERQVLRDAQDANSSSSVSIPRESSSGASPDLAGRFGDEPVLIARRAGVPVWVGAERFAAGRAAEAEVARGQTAGPSTPLRSAQDDKQNKPRKEAGTSASPQDDNTKSGRRVHLMDDGFQHRGLARALDVVVVTAEDLRDTLLPAGNRREGLGALRRADAVVVREDERDGVITRLKGRISGDALVWGVRREISFPDVVPVLRSESLEYGHVVFCAIARPADFVRMLREAGVQVSDVVSFPDHHAYTVEDMKRLAGMCGGPRDELTGHGFVTTEKDAVKLTPGMRAQLEPAGPLVVARLEAVFTDGEDVMRAVEAGIS